MGRDNPPHLQGRGKAQGSDGRWMLELIYPNAVNLDAYLGVWLHDIIATAPASRSAQSLGNFAEPSLYLSRPEDGLEFKEMLKETIVAYCPPLGGPVPEEDHAPLPRHASLQNRSSMGDILDRVVRALLRSSSVGQGTGGSGHYLAQGDDPRRNVLSLGCCVAGPQAKSELLSVHGVACAFPNTTANVIRSPPWELLLSRIGDDLMFALLRQHAVLQRLPNRCYMQLAGRPVPDCCRQLGISSGTLSRCVTASPAGKATPAKNELPPSVKRTLPKANIESSDEKYPEGEPRGGNKAATARVSSLLGSIPRPGALSGPGDASTEPGGKGLTAKDCRSPRPVAVIPRQRIFYSSTFVRKAGFPRGHPLNPSGQPPSSTDRSTPKPPPQAPIENVSDDNMAKGDVATSSAARRLARDIFSGQEGSIGHGHAGDSTQGVRHGRPGLQHAGRASTASAGAGKGGRGGGRLPRRLRGAVPLLEEMAKRAHRCNFGRLLEAYCPLPSSVRETTRRCVLGKGRGAAGVDGRMHGEPEPNPSVCSAEGDVEVEVVDALASPLSQDEASGGEEMYGDGEDEGEMCSGSTLKDISPPGEEGVGGDSRGKGGGIRDGEPEKGEEEQEVDSGSTVKDISPGKKGSGSKTRGVEEGEEGEPDERVRKRRRPTGADDTDGAWRRSEGGVSSNLGAAPTVEEDDATSVSTLIDSDSDCGNMGNLDGVWGSGQGRSSGAARANTGHDTHESSFCLGSETSFMELATEHRRVVDFLCQACHRIFPTDLWGSKRNMVCLARAVERFIVLRRHETMSVLEVTAGMRTSDFAWMSLDGANKPSVQSRKPSTGEPAARADLPSTASLEVVENGGGAAARTDRGSPPKESTGEGGASGMVGTPKSGAQPLPEGEPVGSAGVTRGGKRNRRKRRARERARGNSNCGTAGGFVGSGGGGGGGDVSLGGNGTAVGPARDTGKEKRKTKRPGESKARRRKGKDVGGEGQKARGRCPPSELAVRARLLEALVLWTFKDVVVPLVRSLFYVTECETASQEVFFFRKPVWAKFRTASIRHLTARQYQRISAQEAFRVADARSEVEATGRTPSFLLQQDVSPVQNNSTDNRHSLHRAASGGGGSREGGRAWAFPVSSVRLVPKAKGVRAIANLSTRAWADKDRVQWVKGVPLPAPPKRPGLQRTTSNALSVQSNCGGGSTESRGPLVRSGSEGSGRTNAASAGGGRGARGRLGAKGANGGTGVLLPSTNMQLSNAFHVLKHEYLNEPSLVGAGVFGLDDVFARLKPFVSRNLRPMPCPSLAPSAKRANNPEGRTTQSNSTGDRGPAEGAPSTSDGPSRGSTVGDSLRGTAGQRRRGCEWPRPVNAELPRSPRGEAFGQSLEGGEERRRRDELPALYFASVDIKHCYDTVDQARLLDIIRPVVGSEDYVVQKYAKAHPFKAMGRVQVLHVKEAVAMEDMSQFRRRCEALAHESVDTIFTDQVLYGVVSRSDVLDMIEDHITHNVVRVPAAGGCGRDAYFRQAVGIPQGSVLSGLLCNYFFGFIEKRLLGGVLETPLSSTSPTAAPMLGGTGVFGRPDGSDGLGCDRGCIAESGLCLDNHLSPRLDSSGGDNCGVSGEGRSFGCVAPLSRSGRGNGGACGKAEAACGGNLGESFGWSHASVPRDGIDDGERSHRREKSGSGRGSEGWPVEGRGYSMDGLRPFPSPEGDCTLLRQTDDFLLVTTNKSKAEAFVGVMHDRAKTGDWGFSVHETKTMVNFDMAVEGVAGGPAHKVRRIDGTMFPWCGLRFDTQTCEVMANYSRYSKSSVSESVTVESRRAGVNLTAKMKRFMSPKCHALMLDEGELGINSRHTVLLNVYEMLLVCAAKTAASALRLPRGPAGNASLLSNGALETTAYAYSLIQSRSNRRKEGFGTAKGVRCICKIHHFEVTWLGLHAFREVFGAFSTKHRGFTRPKLDMHRALLEAEGGRGLEGRGRTGSRKRFVEESSGGSGGGTPDTRPGRGCGRLRRVVRAPDALNLLRTLTDVR